MHTLLIIDDEAIIRSELCEFFELYGYKAREAAGKDEALGIIAETTVDAALIDYRMPGMNGLDIIRLLHRDYPAIKLIFVTGDADSSILEASLENGASAYFLKPVNGMDIADKLKELLD